MSLIWYLWYTRPFFYVETDDKKKKGRNIWNYLLRARTDLETLPEIALVPPYKVGSIVLILLINKTEQK